MLHDDSLMRNGDNGHALLKTDEPPWTGAKEFNWQRFFGILRKHFLSSTLFAFLIIGVIAAATLRMKDIYEPRARLEIEPPGLDNFSNQDHGGSLEVDPDYLETQAQILKSEELSLAVVRTLHLDRDPGIVGRGATSLELTSSPAKIVADSSPRSQPTISEARQNSPATTIDKIQVIRIGGQVQLSVSGNGQLVPEVQRLNEPERLVLDFPGTQLRAISKVLATDVKPVLAVRSSQYKPDLARVVIDLVSPASYDISKQESMIELTFSSPFLPALSTSSGLGVVNPNFEQTPRVTNKMVERSGSKTTDSGTADNASSMKLLSQPETKSTLSSTEIAQPPQESIIEDHRTRQENIALWWIQKNLTITPVRDSRLIEVGFTSHDPQLSAQVCNTLLSLFIERNYKTRYETTSRASEWLSHQLEDLSQKIEKSHENLADFENANGIVDVDEKQNTIMQKVAELNRQLTQAQGDRIESEAYLKLAEGGNTESLPQIRENQLFQTLTQRFADDRAQLAEALSVYGENNSKVKRLESQVSEMQSQLIAQQKRVVEEFKTSYETARSRELLFAQSLGQMKAIVQDMNEKTIQYNFLKKKTQVDEDLYNTLSARLKEAGISASLRSNDIRIVDQAAVLDTPTGPQRLLNIAIGIILGIFGAIALAFVRENFDRTLQTPDDVRRWTGRRTLGLVPLIPSLSQNGHKLHFHARSPGILDSGKKDGSVSATQRFFTQRPDSAESEAVRRLQASIKMSRPEKAPRVILIASPSFKEGKTTLAVNLAMVLAHHHKTCLVDADMRKLAVSGAFGLSSKHGLNQVLMGSASHESVLFAVPGVQNLSILPVGPKPPDPGELIGSNTMCGLIQGLRDRFDYVVIDSPALIPYADARVLAPLVDGVVLVGLFGSTTQQGIMQSTEILEEIGANFLGVVLNGVDLRSPDYHFYRHE
jgi:capsular exopolysaccharide synthesis family protein